MNPRNFCVTYDVKFLQSRTRSVFLHPTSFRLHPFLHVAEGYAV